MSCDERTGSGCVLHDSKARGLLEMENEYQVRILGAVFVNLVAGIAMVGSTDLCEL